MRDQNLTIKLACTGRSTHKPTGIDAFHGPGRWSSGLAMAGLTPARESRRDARGTWHLRCPRCHASVRLSAVNMDRLLDGAAAAGVSQLDLARLHL
jgi:hypothetical protein